MTATPHGASVGERIGSSGNSGHSTQPHVGLERSRSTFTPHAAPVDADTASLLALVEGDPVHERDRAVILAAIIQTARDHSGIVDPNALRALLGTVEHPAVIGAVIASLRHRGVLREAGWVITKGSRSRNGGKPQRRYALHLP